MRCCRFLILPVLLAITSPLSAQVLNSVSEGDIAALFGPGVPTTPILTTHDHFTFSSDNHGSVASAVYDLRNGLFVYAYEFLCESGITYTITGLTVPIPSASNVVPTGEVTTGVFWTGLGPFGNRPYTGPFAFLNSLETFPVDASTDPITSGTVSATFVSFFAPGVFSVNNNLPRGVFLTTPVFGFIANQPPTIVTGRFATGGVPWPPLRIVAPGGITLLDPVPDLLDGPEVTKVDSDLATKGRLVKGVAADGVTQLVVRIPADSVGEQLTLTMLSSTSIDEVGGLAKPGDINSATGLPNATSTLSISAVDPDGPGPLGPMAFAIYLAPVDFPRPSGVDASASARTVTIRVQSTMTRDVPIQILRPPVILVHGLWGNPAGWDHFTPLITDSRFFVRRVNYDHPIQVSASVPAYTPDVLAGASTNSIGFGFNAGGVLGQIRAFIENFKSGQNSGNAPVAAVQADIVAHSMGGDVARTLPLRQSFFRSETFTQGSIHKLITIGTPHLGSPLATRLLQDANSCIRDILASKQNISFTSATVLGRDINGAVGDLRGDGRLGGSLSDALMSLNQPILRKLRTGLVAGEIGAAQLGGLDCMLPCNAAKIRFRCARDPLAQNLTSQGWPSIFGQTANDAIVHVSSQLTGLPGFQGITRTALHSAGMEILNFGGPIELEPASSIPVDVINLLNKPITAIDFIPLPP